MHKDPRNKKQRHILGKDYKFHKNRQIKIVGNRKIKITYDLMNLSMATSCWSWDKILDSVGAGKKYPS